MNQTADSTNANGSANAAPAASNADSDLNGLLAQFEQGNAAVAKFAEFVKPLAEFVHEERNSKIQAKYDSDFKEAVSYVKQTDGLPNMPDRIVQGFMRQYASEHPDFDEAWQNRATNPEAWKRAREIVRDAFKEEVKELPTKEALDALAAKNAEVKDIKAAKAAVADQSTRPAPSITRNPIADMAMSDRDWNAHMKSVIAGQAA